VATDLLEGAVTPAEQVRMSMVQDHAAVALLAELFHRAVLAQSEADGGVVAREAVDDYPYAARYRCDRPLFPRGDGYVLPAGTPFKVAFLPDPQAAVPPEGMVSVVPRGMVSERDSQAPTISMDLDQASLYEAAMKRIEDARKLRPS
jgi:hypothetical protein